MIYGERVFAFNETTSNSTDKNLSDELIKGFPAVYALAEATDNYDLLESYSDILANYIDNKNEIVNEEARANTKYTNIIKSYSYQWREAMKAGKKLVKEDKYKEAKVKFKESQDVAIKMLEKIKNVKNDTVGTAVRGGLIYNVALGTIMIYLLPCLVLSVPIIKLFGAKGVAATIFTFNIDAIYSMINLFKSALNDKEKITKSLNFYKNNIEAAGKLLKDISTGCINACNEKMKTK